MALATWPNKHNELWDFTKFVWATYIDYVQYNHLFRLHFPCIQLHQPTLCTELDRTSKDAVAHEYPLDIDIESHSAWIKTSFKY